MMTRPCFVSEDSSIDKFHRMSGIVQVFGRRQDVLSTRSCGRRPKSAKAEICGTTASRRPSEDERTCARPSPEGGGSDRRRRSGDSGATNATFGCCTAVTPPAAQERGDLPPAGGGEDYIRVGR